MILRDIFYRVENNTITHKSPHCGFQPSLLEGKMLGWTYPIPRMYAAEIWFKVYEINLYTIHLWSILAKLILV